MERSVGFFEAWRAKKREKKNEETETVSGGGETTGVLSKYLKMRNSDAELGLNGAIAVKPGLVNEKEKQVNGFEGEGMVKPLEKKVSNENQTQDRMTKAPSKAVQQDVRRPSLSTTPAASRRNSFDSSSRRGSLISPLTSFANIQERILTLSQEQNDSTTRKTVKVNKLTEDAFRIGKQTTTKEREELAKPIAKLNPNLESKLTKFEVGKFTEETSVKKKIIKSSSQTKEKGILNKTGVKTTEGVVGNTKSNEGVENELKDSKSISVVKTQTQAVKTENKKPSEKEKLEVSGMEAGSGQIKEKTKEVVKPNEEVTKVQPPQEKIKKNEENARKLLGMENKSAKVDSTTKEPGTKDGKTSENPGREGESAIQQEDTPKNKSKIPTGKSEPPKKVKEGVKKKVDQPVKTQKSEPVYTETQTKSKKEVDGDKETGKGVKRNEPKKEVSGEGGSEVKGTEATGPRVTKVELEKGVGKVMEEMKKKEDTKTSRTGKPPKTEIFQKELIEEAVKFQEGMTVLTKRANQLSFDLPESEKSNEDRSEDSCLSLESGKFRKDPRKLEKKLKSKSTPNECYPKSQKLLTGKPVNAFEQAKLEESKMESVVSPTKVEAFLRETLSPPTLSGEKDPVKTLEAVVEEILTSKSEKSKHEKPSTVRYTSRGEVICGVVSIKPSSKEEDTDGLSAITLVPAFRPEKSILEEKPIDRPPPYPDTPENPEGVEAAPRYEKPEDGARDCFSPISDFSDDSYDHYVASIDYSYDSSFSRRRSLRSSSTPRRIFPQIVKPSPYRIDRAKEESPVVFDAGLSFDIGSNRTSLRHRFKPQPAFTDMKTTSSSLSMRISDFLRRTDHIMEEWKLLGKGGEDLHSLVQVPSSSFSARTSSGSKSATNIMIKGLLNYSKGSRTPSLRSRSLAKTSEASDRTISDIDELSEMTLDLSEERATGTMQSERLEAETAERVRLEQELAQVQSEKKNLQQTSERLEMELFYARADVNGLSESEADLEDGGGDAALYKNKCERAMRELEFTRRRLQQQHEDDLEQLVALKKQLEKKLADAYEEVEEQRQVAAQWKRKVQKFQSETNDLRLLLEEQSSRNNLLEKKQRKFDSEIQMLQEELRAERNQKERLSREKEMAVAEKYSLEQNLSSVRLELELKEEKVSALAREVEELSRGGGTEQEVTQLRKAKHDLEMKLKEQEEELDELAGQVSMLEGNKLRLEMSLESLRKEHRREMAQRDDELDEVRANAQKKIKVLESQLESEHEERTLLVREKHELERRLADAEERGRHHRAADEDALQRARRDLKKTKALLRDAQVMLERAKQDSPSKAALRALKNQLEDAELARASAVKGKQSLEAELNEVAGQLEEALRAKGDAENRCQAAVREMNSLRTQVDENEEELAELLKKYRQTVQQLSAEQLASQETASALAEAEAERASLRDQLAELTARLEANAVVDPISGIAQKKLEIRIKELESRLELEQTTRGRLEVQITRLKENVERLNEECAQARTKEQTATDLTRKLQRSLREAKEELALQQAKEQEAIHKRKELEKRLETAEAETATAKTDLRLAVKRIEDLQSAISGEIGSDSDRSESEDEDSENDSLVSHVPSTLSSTSRASRTPDLTPR